MIALTVWTLLGNLLLLAVVLAGATVALIYMAIQQMARVRVQPTSAEPPEALRGSFGKAQAWARTNGFEPLGYYQMAGTWIAGWQHKTRPTYFCMYITNGQDACDFVTEFSEGVSLTTGNSTDAHLLPRPAGRYAQAFPSASLDEQWQRHMDMEAYLAQQGRARPWRSSRSLQDAMNESQQEQVSYVRSLAAWPARAVWWYFVRRNRWRDLSILDQRQLGWIRLPNEQADGVIRV